MIDRPDVTMRITAVQRARSQAEPTYHDDTLAGRSWRVEASDSGKQSAELSRAATGCVEPPVVEGSTVGIQNLELSYRNFAIMVDRNHP